MILILVTSGINYGLKVIWGLLSSQQYHSCKYGAVFTLTDMPFKGGVIVEDTKKQVLPEVPGFGFIGFDNE